MWSLVFCSERLPVFENYVLIQRVVWIHEAARAVFSQLCVWHVRGGDGRGKIFSRVFLAMMKLCLLVLSVRQWTLNPLSWSRIPTAHLCKLFWSLIRCTSVVLVVTFDVKEPWKQKGGKECARAATLLNRITFLLFFHCLMLLWAWDS